MRKLLFILLIVCTHAIGQTKGDNTIVVSTSNTDGDNIQNLKELLLDNRFFIKSDSDSTITTELRNSKTKPNWSHQYMYQIRFKDGQIIIMPYWTTGVGLEVGMVTAQPQLEEWSFSDRKNINGFIYHETVSMLRSDGYTDIEFR